MPRDYGTLAPNKVRRHDREVTDEAWIVDFLNQAPYGVIATNHDGQPFVNSNLFVYEEATHSLYFHTARVGRTQANFDTEEGVPVCFSAFSMGRMLPAPVALEFSVEYAGVTAFGTGSLVEDPDEAKRTLQLLLDKYAPHLRPDQHYTPVNDEELKRTAVFRIQIDSWSAKQKKVEEEFPGAYLWPLQS